MNPARRTNRLRRNRQALCAIGLLSLLLVAVRLSGQAGAASPLDAERALLARGQYQEAIAQLEKTVSKAPDNAEALALLMEARIETGEYRKAFDEGEEYLKRSANAGVAAETAEAAMRIGEYQRAGALVEKVSTSHALWLRGELADRNGEKEAAREAFERLAGLLTERRPLSSDERRFAASALAELGRFKEANQAFQDAVKNDPKNAALKTAWGQLLAEKHNPADAAGLFQEALELNPKDAQAMVGMAGLAADRWEAQASQWIQRATAVNPNLAEAHLLTASNALDEDDYKTADGQIEQVLKINPHLLEAWSLRAVYEYLQAFLHGENAPQDPATVARILKENPHYGRVFADLADACFEKRQIPESVAFYRRALALDASLDDARARLGINLFRLGDEKEARAILEDAYARDPYNVWTVNTLRLMDSFSKFDTFETPHFSVKLQKKESEVLRPYVEELLEKTVENLSGRYGFRPRQKVTFEMYPDHEDFAVRTVGLPGLGALGATIGNVVAMDSPSARPLGTFHWGSTLWHETAHVISLGMTSGRVPRWFTEGLSVYEETHARPGWGDPIEMETVDGLQKHRLLPLAELNGAFVRPKYPGQIQFAYYQGGMICEFIAAKYGFPKILAMLHAYAQGRNDAEAIHDALGLTIAEFDAAFMEFVRKETNGFAENVDLKWSGVNKKIEVIRQGVEQQPRNFFARLSLAEALAKESKWEEAAREAQAAKELFPLYVGRANPYRILADAYEAQGHKDKAAAELDLWRKQKGRDPETFKKLARLLKELGRTDEAIGALEEALYISISDVEIHDLLGEWYLERSRPQAALREYRVALALGPADQAGAHYHLANAYHALSDAPKARAEVLAALEIAPGYRPAQKLLLELSGK
jgi:tetratricopeptide (TPR) repeat protein